MAPKLPEMKNVPQGEVRESKSNPRRRFDGEAMKELTSSIRSKGVLVPLLVRPIVDGSVKYEIVAGARRFRAAVKAGLETIPVQIREMEDKAALEIQIIENLQREDVHEIEEADGYRALIDKAKLDVETVAKRIGKSVSYVYQRLKLADLIEPAKKAFLEDRITAGHAILIARLQPAAQKDMLGYTLRDGASVRDVGEQIGLIVHQDLSKAPWKWGDAKLLPKAGTCEACPKRAGSKPDLYPDVKPSTCTDKGCFRAKLGAYRAGKEKELKKETGEKALRLTNTWYTGGKGGPLCKEKWREVKEKDPCKDTKKGILVDDNAAGKTLTVCTNNRCRKHTAPAQTLRKLSIAQKAKKAKEIENAKVRNELHKRTIAKVCASIGPALTRKQLDRIACGFFSNLWHDHHKTIFARAGWEAKRNKTYGYVDYTPVFEKNIRKLPVKGVNQILFHMAMIKEVQEHDEKALKRFAGDARVNMSAIEKGIRAELTTKKKSTKTAAKKTKSRKPAKAKRSKSKAPKRKRAKGKTKASKRKSKR